MKKILAALSTLLLVGSFAFAEASFKADDLKQAESITEAIEVNGFTISASADKDVRVKASKKVAPDGTSFTQRLELRGKSLQGLRLVKFTAKKGETITVYGNSGSKDSARSISITDGKGKSLYSFDGDVYTGDVSVGSFTVKADGEYTVRSTDGGVYIYGITVK